MPKPRPSPLSAALRFLRFASGWSEEELGRALGVTPALISRYERGTKKLSRERLEELLAVIGVPPEAIDATLYALDLSLAPESLPSSPYDLTPAELRSIHRMAAVAGQAAVEATRARLTANLQRLLAERARDRADELSAVRSWVLRRRPSIVSCDGAVAEPVAGGAALHRLLAMFRSSGR